MMKLVGDSTYKPNGKGAGMHIDWIGFVHWLLNAVTIGAILGWLPPMAALVTCVWYTVLLIEKRTGTSLKDWCRKKD